jgi:uncharacterized surface protein with fasciclin (FAS1) repeats
MRIRMLGTACAVALALVLTGCGSDSDDSADSTPAPSTPAAAPAGDIVTVASGAPQFSTLVAAVTAADLATTLQGPGPFTVFAPNDAAFAALPAGVLDKLLLPENKAVLTKILTYHVVPGTVKAADIQPGDVATVEGQSVTLATAPGVTVNEIGVVTADIEASNGVIHEIEGVLIPPDVDPAAL